MSVGRGPEGGANPSSLSKKRFATRAGSFFWSLGRTKASTFVRATRRDVKATIRRLNGKHESSCRLQKAERHRKGGYERPIKEVVEPEEKSYNANED
jgi:hypothetical protein